MNIPEWIVELRHKLTHKKMPHINDCRRGGCWRGVKLMGLSWVTFGDEGQRGGLYLVSGPGEIQTHFGYSIRLGFHKLTNHDM